MAWSSYTFLAHAMLCCAVLCCAVLCCALLLQLRDQEERLAELVDGMVQGYHSGFARSIQNYSQILNLFGEAKDQVGSSGTHSSNTYVQPALLLYVGDDTLDAGLCPRVTHTFSISEGGPGLQAMPSRR
jgi:hypothetical protein